MKKQKVDATVEDEDEDLFTAGPPKPKKKLVAPKLISSTSSPAAAALEGRPAVFAETWGDLKDAKMAYIPVFFK